MEANSKCFFFFLHSKTLIFCLFSKFSYPITVFLFLCFFPILLMEYRSLFSVVILIEFFLLSWLLPGAWHIFSSHISICPYWVKFVGEEKGCLGKAGARRAAHLPSWKEHPRAESPVQRDMLVLEGSSSHAGKEGQACQVWSASIQHRVTNPC